MSTSIVTTFSPKYWKRTAQYTVKDWRSYMPSDWNLILHNSPKVNVGQDLNLTSSKKDSWYNSAKLIEKDTRPGFMKEWNKFYHKSFAQWETYEHNPNGILIWMDADVKFKKPLTDALIKECLNDKFCAYLGRDRVNTQDPIFEKRYSQYDYLSPETCFIVYNLNHPLAKDFFNSFKEIYTSMKLFDNFSWCDAGAFITTVNKFSKESFNDITGHLLPTPLPLNVSILDEYLEHWIGTANKKNKTDNISASINSKVFKND